MLETIEKEIKGEINKRDLWRKAEKGVEKCRDR